VFLRTQRQLYSPPGELYCFAVIFDLRRVVFATRVLGANRISLLCLQSNITFAAAKISRCLRQHITKNYQEMRTYSPPNAVAQMKNSRYGIKSISAVLLSFRTRRILHGICIPYTPPFYLYNYSVYSATAALFSLTEAVLPYDQTRRRYPWVQLLIILIMKSFSAHKQIIRKHFHTKE